MQGTSTTSLSEFQLIIARLALGLAQSWEVPPVADRALSNRVYCDAIAELALLPNPIMSDVMPLVARAVKELDLATPSRADAAWLLARNCMERLVKGEEQPFDVLGELRWVLNAAEQAMPGGKYVGQCLDVGELIGIYWCYTEPTENYYEPEKRLITDETERRMLLDTLARKQANGWLLRHPLP